MSKLITTVNLLLLWLIAVMHWNDHHAGWHWFDYFGAFGLLLSVVYACVAVWKSDILD